MTFKSFSYDKHEIGLRFILDSLELSSPLGRERLMSLEFLATAEIIAAHNSLEHTINAIKPDYSLLYAISAKLCMLKDLRKIAADLEARTLEDFELFELKCFLIVYEECSALNNNRIICLPSLSDALGLLDADNRRAMTFRVEENQALLEIRKKKTSIESELSKNPDNSKLAAVRAILAAAESDEELAIRTGLCLRLKPHSQNLLNAMNAIGDLDFLLAKAKLALSFNAIRPEIVDNNALHIDEAFNPYADFMLKKRGLSYIPISIELNSGATIITGANMGGKSLSMKTILLNQLLFQLGFFVFAKSAYLCVFEEITAIFDDGQSVEKGLSSFGAQIIELNRAFRGVKTRKTLLIADELASGTNPHEGERIVRAVAKVLNKYDSVSLLSTHYDNAAPMGICHYQVIGLKNCDFEKLKLHQETALLNVLSREMDYRLELKNNENKSPRDAMRICKLLGMDIEILNEYEVE